MNESAWWQTLPICPECRLRLIRDEIEKLIAGQTHTHEDEFLIAKAEFLSDEEVRAKVEEIRETVEKSKEK